MSQRKKPQQQLASYFDELLTELEEPAASVEHNNHATNRVDESINTTMNNTKANFVAAHTQPSAPKVNRTIHSKASRDTPHSMVKNQQTLPAQTSFASKQSVIKPSPPKQSLLKQELPKPAPQAKKISGQNVSDKPVTVVDSELDLRQREKARLERLLKSLTPVPSAVTSEPELTQAKKTIPKTAAVTDNKKVVAPTTEPQTPSVKAVLDTQKVIKPAPVNEKATSLSSLDSTDIDLAAMIDTQTDHQWEPVAHEWLDNGRPAWGDSPFDVLLVDLSGIQLAMPLVALDAINPLSDELTPLFGQAEWFMGLQKTITGNVNVINTSQFIMPERYKPEAQARAKYSVAINGSGWALAVDKIHQPITIDPADIRWRKRRSERPWMAGTIKDHVCALIDIPTLANLLKTSDKNRSFQ
ncbi:chemotaxis protein CheW [Eionea flava]